MLTYPEVMSLVALETIEFVFRFETTLDGWRGMIDGTDMKNLNTFYKALKTTLSFAVMKESNPNVRQVKKNGNKKYPSHSYYEAWAPQSIDVGNDYEEAEDTSGLDLGEENKLPHEQEHRYMNQNKLAEILKNEELRNQYFTKTFNERYELIKEIDIMTPEGERLAMKELGMKSSLRDYLVVTTKRVIKKHNLQDERVIYSEKPLKRRIKLYEGYFNLLDELEPKEELKQLSKWLSQHEKQLENLLYDNLTHIYCKDLTLMYKGKKLLHKKTLYRVSDILHRELIRDRATLKEIEQRNREINYREP